MNNEDIVRADFPKNMKRIDARELVGKTEYEGEQLRVLHLMLIADDIDCYDDVTEELGLAFCNPFDDDNVHLWSEYLTEEGMNKFAEVLFYPMHINPYDYGYDYPCAIIEIDGDDGEAWEERLNKASEFFGACAGYCSCEDYDKWFKI